MQQDKYILEDTELLIRTYPDVFEALRNKSVLVTGATGLLTTYLCKCILSCADKYDICLYLQCRSWEKAEKIYKDYLGNGYAQILTFDLISGNLPDIKFDYIIHAASMASTKYFVETPVDVILPNVVGTYRLLELAKKTGTEKFLFFSSNSIYGEGGTDKEVLSENDYGIVDPLGDRASYIESKRLAEQMCRAFYKQYGVNTNIIRITHTYGPTFDIEHDMRILPRVIKSLLADKEMVMYKDPSASAQYTYIADMIAAVLHILVKGIPGEVYNAGADELVKIDDAVSWMIDASEKADSAVKQIDIDENYNFSKGKGVNDKMVSNEKLKSLGWHQLYTPKDGFARMVRCYMEDSKNSAGGGI